MAIAAGPRPTPAQPRIELAPPPVLMMAGTCTALSTDGADDTAGCTPSAVRWALPNGRTMFLFGHSHLILAFTGPAVVGAWGEANTQPIDMVRITTRASPDIAVGIPSTGSCTFGNPYAGTTHITCDAIAPGHHFHIAFITDGTPPRPAR